MRWVGRPGQDAPRLGDRIDPALDVDRRAQRRAVVEERAAIPVAVPAVPLQRRGGGPSCGCASARRAASLAARVGDRGERGQDRVQEPAQPDALAATLVADPVHPVVPVARPDQRQAVRADAPGWRRSPGRNARTATPTPTERSGWKYASSWPARSGGAVDERHRLVEDARVAGDRHVAIDRVRQPQAIVRDPGPDAPAGRRMPPVLDVALRELLRGRAQQVLADELRARRRSAR